MANFPETPKPIVPYRWTEVDPPVAATIYPNGQRRANLLGVRNLFACELRYPARAPSTYNDLLDFIAARRGTFESFTFTDFHGHDASPIGKPWRRLHVCIATGAAQTVDLPTKSATSISIYDGDTLKTVTTHYTLNLGGGSDGKDQITLLNGQFTVGGIVEITAVCRRSMKAILVNPKRDFENPYEMLMRTGLSVQEIA